MTPERNKNYKSSETRNAGSTGNFPTCGPGCGCGGADDKGKGNGKLRVAIFLLVVAAVCGIVLFKTSSSRQNASAIAKTGFSNPTVTTGSNTPVNSAGQREENGASLPSIDALNTVAANLNTVFLLIPDKNGARIDRKAAAALASVERVLNAKGIKTGIFILQTGSPDYPDIAARVAAPGIAVLTKGRGMGFVSGRISKTSLMQAYVASTRTGCGCSGGCKKPATPAS